MPRGYSVLSLSCDFRWPSLLSSSTFITHTLSSKAVTVAVLYFGPVLFFPTHQRLNVLLLYFYMYIQ